ncbi:hypothetical protein BKA61DRAFT_684016 [Leptodontidium sp. MPI-SDFR-AT-0119]|nr:hypothetical protein BKA61DRAFT_684016 [Leptodontidium sp. MPI-SDFR-AT-0119]
MSLPVRRVYMLLCVLGISALCSAQINLGEAKSYGILGRLSVTNTGSTVINGGLRTGGTSVTGFYPPGIVNGNIVLGDATGAAFLDATAAYTNITAATPAVDLTGSDLGGMNLRPGTYTFSSTAQLTGTLTLNGTGSPNDQWYFQIGKALTTASAAAVIFVNGGKACRVYWAVGSAATLGTGTSFAGTIIAGASVTFDTSASLIRGAFGMSATVTLDSNLVTVPDCSVSSSSSSIVQGSSTTPAVNSPTPGVPASGSTTRLSISTSIFLHSISAAVLSQISNVFQPSTPSHNSDIIKHSEIIIVLKKSLFLDFFSPDPQGSATGGVLTFVFPPFPTTPGPDPQGSATGDVLTIVFPPFHTGPDELPYSEFAPESTVSRVESTAVTYPVRSTTISNSASSASFVSQTIGTQYSKLEGYLKRGHHHSHRNNHLLLAPTKLRVQGRPQHGAAAKVLSLALHIQPALASYLAAFRQKTLFGLGPKVLFLALPPAPVRVSFQAVSRPPRVVQRVQHVQARQYNGQEVRDLQHVLWV